MILLVFVVGKLLDREVRVFGISMRLRYWIATFTFLIIAIIGYLLALICSPLIYDLVGTSIGTAGLILAMLSAIYGATRGQIELFREEIIGELKGVRKLLEEILKTLSKT